MSTKIFNAYKYVGGGTLEALLEKLSNLKEQHFQLTVEMLRGTVKDFSQDTPKEKAEKCNIMEACIREDMKTGLDTIFNLTANVVVYPFEDELYVQFFGLDRKIKLDEKNFVDFHYQNQTDDTPEGISYEKFQERGKVWDKIFDHEKGRFTPIDSGFTFELVSKDNVWHICHTVFRYVT